MNLLCGTNVSDIVDYSFGDHHVVWDKTLKGIFKIANFSNAEFLIKCKEFEGKVMTLFIDNIRLYSRSIELNGPHAQNDAQFINYLMQTNDLLNLCSQFPNNKFIIFTGEEDTPIDDQIRIPDNVLKIYGVNALYNNDRIIPFPFGLQRQRGENDDRLEVMARIVEHMETGISFKVQSPPPPPKLLYINCGIERNPERLLLAKFETNNWVTARFDKDSMFFSYDRYNEFLSELKDHRFVVCPKGHGYDTHRIWETLYMRRVPIMLDDPYFKRLLKGFPVLFISNWYEVIKQILEANDWLYQQAQIMDMSKLDLDKIYQNAIK